MKRTLLFATCLIAAVVVKAQSPLAFGSMYQPSFRHFHQLPDTNSLQKKWFFSKYVGISTGFIGFNGRSGAFLSAPVGVQINRRLTDHVYAFAGVSVAPSYFPYSTSFYQPGAIKNYGLMNPNNLGIYSTAELGLMYINSERTFSISGSIGVSRSSYNYYAPLYAPVNSSGVRHR